MRAKIRCWFWKWFEESHENSPDRFARFDRICWSLWMFFHWLRVRRLDKERVIKIGLSGGTFNMIHTWHTLVGNAAGVQYRLNFVLFIPSGTPPLKTGVVFKWRRFVWTYWSCVKNALLVPCPVEVCRPGRSFTVDTMQQLRRMYASWGYRVEFYWITGMDNVRGDEETGRGAIREWNRAPEFLAQCKLLIAPRDQVNLTPERITELLLGLRPGEHWNLIQVLEGGVSSSILRQAFADGSYAGCPQYLLHYKVMRDIVECNPYVQRAAA